jgi:BirA family biotin operon repressor/biotin-[acetyl-CoA-carboxylase] ligase
MNDQYLEMDFPQRRRLGRRVLYFAQLNSTNSRILEFAANPLHEGLVILADEQTAGRGTRGRHWFCPAGSGLLFSLLLVPPTQLRRPVVLSALAAVAVCETIFTHLKRQACIKWPNDVLIKGKKVCGILIEKHPAVVVMGIGINVDISEAEFQHQGLSQASSLSALTTETLHRMELFGTLLDSLDAYYAEILEGQLQDLEARWRWHSSLLGRQVILQAGEEVMLGRLLEQDFDRIEMRTSGGQMRSFRPEEVERISLLQ